MSTWDTLVLSPLDTLFLRDGRPFNAGEGSHAETIFPPTPFTTQGLVRSKLLAAGCGRWDDYRRGCDGSVGPGTTSVPCPRHGTCAAQETVGRIGQRPAAPGRLEVRGPWLLIDGRPVLSAPLDLVAASDDLNRAATASAVIPTAILVPVSSAFRRSNLPGALAPLEPPPVLAGKKFEGVPGWIAWERYVEYLHGRPPALTPRRDWWRRSDILRDELRPGLEIEDGRSRAQRGHLYFARHVRPGSGWSGSPNVQLAVEVQGVVGNLGTEFLDFPLSPFGGERRAVGLEKCPSDPIPWRGLPDDVREEVERSRRVKLVLVQPAWFGAGWAPRAWDKSTGIWRLRLPDGAPGAAAEIELTLQAARLERADVFGGWDLARGEQKPVRRFVQRGAVYYLECASSSSSAILSRVWNACLSETPDGEDFAYPRLGLGHVFLGTWQPTL
jgi:CRISPR-associated protein Cmr3